MRCDTISMTPNAPVQRRAARLTGRWNWLSCRAACIIGSMLRSPVRCDFVMPSTADNWVRPISVWLWVCGFGSSAGSESLYR